jgi:hypothetical protein
METEQTHAAPAGDGEPTSLSVHAAAGLLAGFSDNEPEQAQAESQETVEEPVSAEPPSEPGDEPATEETASEEASPAEEAEPQAETETEADNVHGNAWTTLRDGRRIRVAEAKKAFGELEELRANLPNIVAQHAQQQAQQIVQQRTAQIAQQEQLFSQVLPAAMQLLQANIPPEPDPALLQSDPIAHYEQTVARNAKLVELQKMQAAAAAHRQQAAQVQQANLNTYLTEQRSRLVEKIPDLAAGKAKEVYQGFVDTASQYGFTPEEVNQVYDHRLLHMVHDLTSQARELKALKAEQAKAKAVAQKKVEAAPPVAPVQQPGRRVSSNEAADRAREDQFQRLRSRGGRLEDAARLLMD